MRKIFFPLTLLLVGFAASFAQQYDIRLNLEVGQKVPIRSTTVAKNETYIPDLGPYRVTITASNELVFTVLEKKGENYIIEGVITKISGIVEIEGQKKIEMSSEESEENMYNKEFKALAKRPFKAEITPKFRLIGEVKPVDENVTPERAALVFAAFKNFYSCLYPEKTVAANSTWEETISLEALNFPNIPIKNKLASVTAEYYIIEGTTTMEVEQDGIKMKGTGNFKNEVRRDTGIPIRGEMTMPMEGNLPSEVGGATIKAFGTMSFEYVE